MIQTENTAIVLRRVNYRDNDRMVTLLSPSRGRIDAVIRNCRKPKSHNLNAAELFALGDYMIVETGGRMTVTSVRLIETFWPLRNDYDRLTCAAWLLSLAEAAAEPEQEQQELFMLLLHTLSRLASPASTIAFTAESGRKSLPSFSMRRKAVSAVKAAAAPGPRSRSPRSSSAGCAMRSPSAPLPGSTRPKPRRLLLSSGLMWRESWAAA